MDVNVFDDNYINPDDQKISEEELFASMSEGKLAQKGEHTFLVKNKKRVFEAEARPQSAGVIDKAEWDEMLKLLDEEAARREQEGDVEEEIPSLASTGGRSARSQKKEPLIVIKRKKKKTAAKTSKASETSASSNGPKKKKQKSKKKKIFVRIILALLALCIAGAAALGIFVIKVIKETPAINPSNIYDLLTQSSVIYDINGNAIDNIYSGDALRTNVEYKDIPKDLVQAFVSIEDKTFWDHHGFNFVRIAGAIWQKVSGKSDKIGGTSTITQQLARNIFLSETKRVRSYTRKIQEAYYTLQIEKALTKEQIVEAYLNTVYLGFNSNGVSAAARAYFDKDLSDLNLIECACLASLPQSPNNYAPLKRVAADAAVNTENLDIIAKNESWITYYNDTVSDRIKLVLRFMHEQGKIDDETYELAKTDSIRNYVCPGVNVGNSANESSYFTDYIVSKVMSDLQNTLGYTYSEAYELLYNGGLVVNSTLDMSVQSILEEEYNKKDIFPTIKLSSLTLDKQKNILNPETEKVILYAFGNMINSENQFVLKKGEYEFDENGNLILFKGNRLNFYNTKANGISDVRIDIKDMYEVVDGQLYSRSGSYFVIDSKYKIRNDAGSTIISSEFFAENPDAITKNDDGSILFSPEYYVLGSRIIQPQSAMVIIDNSNGQIRAMMGGRNISGKLLYNRATATRQPGSSMKPLAIYSTALQLGYDRVVEAAENKKTDDETVQEPIFTAAYPLDSIPFNSDGELWPSNFDGTYTGITSLRRAVEKSLNACAINLYMQLDPKMCVENVLNLGITSLVLNGSDTDENPSSLALGGMIKGVSPLEMASAYSTFGNYGIHNDYSCYTTVTDRKGNVILKSDTHSVQVLDECVASLMLDILHTTVTNGIASGAKISSQPSAGKTGTTSDMYDLWFCGLTPKYSAAVWLGCDTNISLGADSSKATKVWKSVMERVGKLDDPGEFELRGDFVTATVDRVTGMLPETSELVEVPEEDLVEEIFIKGTEPVTWKDGARGYVEICAQTGYLATPYCHSTYKEYIQRPGGESWETLLAKYVLYNVDDEKLPKDQQEKTPWTNEEKLAVINLVLDCSNDPPQFYCPIHNPDPLGDPENGIEALYPISPIIREEYDVPEPIDGEGGHWEVDEETGEEYWVWDEIEFGDEDEEDSDREHSGDEESENPKKREKRDPSIPLDDSFKELM